MAQETTLKIPALHCGGCAATVTRTLEVLPGVEVTETDPEAQLVQLRFDDSATSLDEIRDALDQVGFSPEY